MIAMGTAEQTETRRAFDNPRVRGTCRTRRSVHQARAIIVMASKALPIAPAVVPRDRAPSPTAARSMIVAARLIPRIGFVFPIACSVMIRRRLWAENMIVTASMAKGIAPARSEGP